MTSPLIKPIDFDDMPSTQHNDVSPLYNQSRNPSTAVSGKRDSDFQVAFLTAGNRLKFFSIAVSVNAGLFLYIIYLLVIT